MTGIYQIKRLPGGFKARQTTVAGSSGPVRPDMSPGYTDTLTSATGSPANNTFNVCALWRSPSQGATLSAGNPVHKVFCIESEVVPIERIEKAYEILTEILKRARDHLDKNPHLTPPEKLMSIYVIMKEMGIKLEDQEDSLFTYNLVGMRLDCDTSSFVVMALAYEFDWPLRLVVVSKHAFIRWQGNKHQFNIDRGLILPDWYYRWSFDLSNKDVSDISSSFLAQALANRATYYSTKLRRFKIAIKDLDEALATDPENVIARHNRAANKLMLAYTYRQLEKDGQASRYYNEARNEIRSGAGINPYLYYVLYRFERTYGHRDEAAEDLKIGARAYFKEGLELPKRFFANLLMPRYLISSPVRF